MNILEVIERLKLVYVAKNDNQLASLLEIPNSYIARWKRLDSIPFDVLDKVAKENSISLDWLVYGDRKTENKKQELIEKWNNRPERLSLKKINLIKKALDEKADNSTTVPEVVEKAIMLYDFDDATSYEDFITILTCYKI